MEIRVARVVRVAAVVKLIFSHTIISDCTKKVELGDSKTVISKFEK